MDLTMTGNAYAAQHASHSVTLAALLVVTLQVSDPLKDEVCGCCGCLQLSSSLIQVMGRGAGIVLVGYVLLPRATCCGCKPWYNQ
jgi:hypothetical protein